MAFSDNLLFIHIPKNGGTSIIKSLGLQHDGHYAIDFYKRHMPEGVFNSCRKFAVSRNPWDRVVSCYEYARMETSYWHSSSKPSVHGIHPDYEVLKDAPFKEAVDLMIAGELKQLGWTDQLRWITIDGNIAVDDIYKIEELPEELYGSKLIHINKSIRKPYQEYYSDTTIDLVGEFFAKDIETLGYTYEKN